MSPLTFDPKHNSRDSPDSAVADPPERPPYPFAATLISVVGIILVVAGTFGWSSLRISIGAENIIVAQDGRYFPGTRVDGPLSAFSQAEVLGRRIDALNKANAEGEDGAAEEHRLKILEEETTRTRLESGVLGFAVAALGIVVGFTFVSIGLLASVRGGRARENGTYS